MDVSPECNPEDAQQFQQLIGMLRWSVELGRIDIQWEVSVLSSHLAMPREGHLEAAFGIFAYLQKHVECNNVYDPLSPEVNMAAFAETSWSKSPYGTPVEELPPDMPEPLGEGIQVSMFVDASHAGDLLTRRSHTGYFIYINNALVC